MQGAELTPSDEILERIDAALAASTADETEIVWHELARCRATSDSAAEPEAAARERGVLVRVYERGRVGIYRTGAGSRGEVDDAVRQALGQSKVDPPPAHRPPLVPKGSSLPLPERSHDRALVDLEADQAAALLGERLKSDESARMRWAEARIAVGNSRGLRRYAAVTAVALEMTSGHGQAAGFSAAVARSLADLAAETVLTRARSRRGEAGGTSSGPDPSTVPLAFSPEAAGRLIELLNHQALATRPFLDGTSFLAGRLGERVLDPAFTLRDDPADAAGLAFPFDYFGGEKQALTLIEEGVPRTPATDSLLGPALGLPVNHLAIGPDDSRAGNLLLVPGELDDGELLAAADGGLWIGWLDEPRLFDAGELAFRARARGVRAVRQGRLGAALPDLILEDRLPRLFGELLGIGRETVCLAAGDGVLEGVRAPAVAAAPRRA